MNDVRNIMLLGRILLATHHLNDMLCVERGLFTPIYAIDTQLRLSDFPECMISAQAGFASVRHDAPLVVRVLYQVTSVVVPLKDV